LLVFLVINVGTNFLLALLVPSLTVAREFAASTYTKQVGGEHVVGVDKPLGVEDTVVYIIVVEVVAFEFVQVAINLVGVGGR